MAKSTKQAAKPVVSTKRKPTVKGVLTHMLDATSLKNKLSKKKV